MEDNQTKGRPKPNHLHCSSQDLTGGTLASAKSSDSGSDLFNHHCGGQSRGQQPWKYDPSLSKDGVSIDGKDPRVFEWCTGPGHDGKPHVGLWPSIRKLQQKLYSQCLSSTSGNQTTGATSNGVGPPVGEPICDMASGPQQ
jgi:hypothetical protein